MFSFREFILNGFKRAIGEMADYKVILNAASWHDKGVLTEADLVEIQALIDAKTTPTGEES